MAGTLDIIRDWATQLSYWEQSVLEKVASGVAITDKDYQKLLNFFMEDVDLVPTAKGSRPALTFPTKLVDPQGAGYTIERLYNLQKVNALPIAQDITFGPQLTVIFGSNGSGKTGYTRPLGCAAFARGEREVLTDARKALGKQVPKADIEIAKDGEKSTISWVNGARCPELSGVYVFDGTSVSAHLTRPNALSFAPAGLSLLTGLAEVTDTVRERLRKLIEMRSAAHSFGAFFSGDSVANREIASLSANTEITRLREVAVLSAEEERRIVDLEQQIAALKTRNIPRRIATLKQEIKDLEKLIEQVGDAGIALGTTAQAGVEALIAELEARRKDAERVGADQFRFGQFTQVGTAVWREFVGAARRLADAEERRGAPYPQSGDACLFCRQTLSPEATDLVRRLWDFLGSDAPTRYQAAQAACRSRAGQFRNLMLSFFGPDAASRRILEIEAPEAVVVLDAFIKACAVRSNEIQKALSEGAIGQLTNAAAPNLDPVHARIKRRQQEISNPATTDSNRELEQLEQALRELQHRQILSRHLADIERWVDQQKWSARAQKSVGSTRHITAKYNELFKTLVTDQYRSVFETTLSKLKSNLKLTIETRGHKGETMRQIILSPDAFAQKIAVDKILSDSEKRSVALADFLTEVTLDTASRAIVLDDPTSSLDPDSTRAVAQMLVDHAQKRQVIVFTHDLTFLNALKVSAGKIYIGVVSHWIRSEQGQPGYVYLGAGPVCESDYKNANIAREHCAAAKNAPPAAQQQSLQQGFGALRTSYEAFVIYDLFNDVVKRFEERISFDRLREVSLDKEVVEQVVGKLGTLSRYIDAHLHSDIFSEKPTPEMLLEEIIAFEEIRKKHKNSKKGLAAAPSDSMPKTVADDDGRTQDAVRAASAAIVVH